LIKEEYTYVSFLYEETQRLQKQGYSLYEANEEAGGMLAGLLGKAGGGIADLFKEKLASWLLSKIGLDPRRPGGWGLIGCAIKNTLGQLTIANMKELFGNITKGVKGFWESSCNTIVDIIMKGITECAADKAFHTKAIEAVVGDTSEPTFMGLGAEMVQNFVNNSEMMTSVREKISTYICALDISEIFSMMQGGLKDAGGALSGMLGSLGSLGGGLSGLFGGEKATA